MSNKISQKGTKVGKVKILTIAKLPPHFSVKAIRSFWDMLVSIKAHKGFLKISKVLTKLLEKDAPFDFNTGCLTTFTTLKVKLVQAPIIVALDWKLPFRTNVGCE